MKRLLTVSLVIAALALAGLAVPALALGPDGAGAITANNSTHSLLIMIP